MPIYLLLSRERNRLSSETPRAIGHRPATPKLGTEEMAGLQVLKLKRLKLKDNKIWTRLQGRLHQANSVTSPGLKAKKKETVHAHG